MTELQQAVGVLLALPALMQGVVAQQVRSVADTLPPRPPGRLQKLTQEMRAAIVDSVTELLQRKVRMGPAQRRTAQRLQVSLRSVQRAWREWDPDAATPRRLESLLQAIALPAE